MRLLPFLLFPLLLSAQPGWQQVADFGGSARSFAAAFVVGLETGRSNHLTVWALNFLLVPFGRAGIKQILSDFGLWQRPAVIIGSGENWITELSTEELQDLVRLRNQD